MKLLLLLLLLLMLIACNGGSGGGSGSDAKVTSADTVGGEAGKSFVQQNNSQIDSNLQIQASDLKSWQQEGLITPEEALTISQNL